MDLNTLRLPDTWFGPGEDLACAEVIEAGLYASHLIDLHGPDPDLSRIVARGREARDRLWAVGLKVAMQQARRLAVAYDLPSEDLFQDGCVAVAEAIERYDFTRGVRFTTFVFEFVIRTLAEGARHRVGRPIATRAAAAAGVSPTAARRALVRMVSLDDVTAADPAAEAGFARVDSHGLDFLSLLSPRHRRVLALRYGLGCEALTLADTARRLGASQSTVHRWEGEAIKAARTLLTGERTALVSGRSPRRPPPPSWNAPPSQQRTPRLHAPSR